MKIVKRSQFLKDGITIVDGNKRMSFVATSALLKLE